MLRYGPIVIGASWGGLNALSAVVGALPADFGPPVVVVQHRGRGSDRLLQELLQDRTGLPVVEVHDKQPLAEGHIYLAPSDYHLLLEPEHFALSTEPAQRYSRPAIDITFESAADTFRGRVIGVVLTGASDDGARGLRRIVDRGGRAIVQSPETAEVAIMPAAARRLVPEAEVLPLVAIGPRLLELTTIPARAGGAPST